ncbi:hypothetical protein RI367_005403 [Sorochytrium milnesiophthora]
MNASDSHLCAVLMRASATLSLMGSIAMVYDMWRNWERLRYSPHRIVLFWSIADLLLVPASLMAQSSFGHPTLCTVQGVIVQFSLLASILWAGVLATNILLAVGLKHSVADILSLEVYYHMIAWGVPLIVAGLPLLLPTPAGKPFYDSAQIWCWIGSNYASARMGFMYGPLWCVVLYCVAVYTYIGVELWKSTADSQQILANSTGKSIDARKRFAAKASMYILALLLAWMCATINRLLDMHGTPKRELAIIHACTVPLQGMLNAIVYFSARIWTAMCQCTLPRRKSNRTAPSVVVDFAKPKPALEA